MFVITSRCDAYRGDVKVTLDQPLRVINIAGDVQ
jgi:hypothetical protein